MTHPLAGVRILELGQIIAGTYGSQVLSDLGAEVIKIEAPEGDLGRIPSVAPYKGVSTLFLTFNRNKKSVVINLKTDAGRALFHDLVRISDVVVDNFRAGVLERLKVDYADAVRDQPAHHPVLGHRIRNRWRLQGLSRARHHHPGDQRPHELHRRAGTPARARRRTACGPVGRNLLVQGDTGGALRARAHGEGLPRRDDHVRRHAEPPLAISARSTSPRASCRCRRAPPTSSPFRGRRSGRRTATS